MMLVVEINAVVPGKINTLHVTVENNGNDVTTVTTVTRVNG